LSLSELVLHPEANAQLTPTQQRCLEHYAFPGLSQPRLWAKRTTDSLVAKGLLERRDHDMGGGLTVHDFEMPLAVHIAYCRWCDEQVTDEEMMA
jgi:hypothetical protein